jgi:hypothetical protein
VSPRMHRYLGRLGLGDLVKDHLNTLYEFDAQNQGQNSWVDIFVFYIVPIFAGLLCWTTGARLYVSDALVGGISILTGFLFGLLIHIFSIGIKVADDARYGSGDKLPILIDELRANVSYACGVGLFITLMLITFVAFIKPTDLESGLNSAMTGIFFSLFAHLVLTLLMVIRRVRSAYKIMAK